MGCYHQNHPVGYPSLGLGDLLEMFTVFLQRGPVSDRGICTIIVHMNMYTYIMYIIWCIYIYIYLLRNVYIVFIYTSGLYIYDIWYMICVYIIIYCMQSYAYMVLPAALPAWYCRPIPSEAQNLDYYIEVPRIYYIMLHKCLCSSHITAVIKIQ